MLYPTVCVTPSETYPLVVQWSDDESGGKLVRLDSETFPDFWLTGRLSRHVSSEKKAFTVTGGRFSADWNPAFMATRHTQFEVMDSPDSESVQVSSAGVTVRIPL